MPLRVYPRTFPAVVSTTSFDPDATTVSPLRLVPVLRDAAAALLVSRPAPAPIPINQDRRSVPALSFCMLFQPRTLYRVRLFHRRQVNPDMNRMIAASENHA